MLPRSVLGPRQFIRGVHSIRQNLHKLFQAGTATGRNVKPARLATGRADQCGSEMAKGNSAGSPPPRSVGILGLASDQLRIEAPSLQQLRMCASLQGQNGKDQEAGLGPLPLHAREKATARHKTLPGKLHHFGLYLPHIV